MKGQTASAREEDRVKRKHFYVKEGAVVDEA